MPRRLVIAFFDILILLLLGLWLCGGFSYRGTKYLFYGPDVRLAATAIALLLSLWPVYRKTSFTFRRIDYFWQWLQQPKSATWFWLALTSLAVTATVWQHFAVAFPLYDVGIFHQVVWSLANGEGFYSSISGAGNFLSDHLALTLALLVPFFNLLGQPAWFLPAIHPLLIFGGFFALIFYCQRSPVIEEARRPLLIAAISVVSACFGSVWSNLWWGFHANSLGVAALWWAVVLWLLAEQGANRRYYIASVLLFLFAGLSKETFLLSVGSLFAVFSWTRLLVRRFAPAIGFILLSACFFALFVWFEEQPHPENKNYFLRYYSYLGHSTAEALGNILSRPWLVFSERSLLQQLGFIGVTLLPWCGLPLIALFTAIRNRDWQHPAFWLLALTPAYLAASLSTYAPLRELRFHYVLELWPLLGLVAIYQLATMAPKITMIWVVLALLMPFHDPIYHIHKLSGQVAANRPLRNLLNGLEPEGEMMAGEILGPWVAGRKAVTRFPETYDLIRQCPKWFVVRATDRDRAAALCPETVGLDVRQKASGWVLLERRGDR